MNMFERSEKVIVVVLLAGDTEERHREHAHALHPRGEGGGGGAAR